MQPLALQKLQIPTGFNVYLVINKYVISLMRWSFYRHYLRNHSTSSTGVFSYIDVIKAKERSSELWQISAGTFCIYGYNTAPLKNNIFP
jgi:predicted aspartyl protease